MCVRVCLELCRARKLVYLKQNADFVIRCFCVFVRVYVCVRVCRELCRAHKIVFLKHNAVIAHTFANFEPKVCYCLFLRVHCALLP